MIFGEKTQICRKSKGLSQEEMASALGVSRQAFEQDIRLAIRDKVLQVFLLFALGLLAAQGYSFLHNFAAVLGFDFLSAVALFFILPRGKYQCLKVLPFVLVITFLFRYFSAADYLIGRIIK